MNNITSTIRWWLEDYVLNPSSLDLAYLNTFANTFRGYLGPANIEQIVRSGFSGAVEEPKIPLNSWEISPESSKSSLSLLLAWLDPNGKEVIGWTNNIDNIINDNNLF